MQGVQYCTVQKVKYPHVPGQGKIRVRFRVRVRVMNRVSVGMVFRVRWKSFRTESQISKHTISSL